MKMTHTRNTRPLADSTNSPTLWNETQRERRRARRRAMLRGISYHFVEANTLEARDATGTRIGSASVIALASNTESGDNYTWLQTLSVESRYQKLGIEATLLKKLTEDDRFPELKVPGCDEDFNHYRFQLTIDAKTAINDCLISGILDYSRNCCTEVPGNTVRESPNPFVPR